MSKSRELLSQLDRAQLYTLVEMAILALGFIGTLVTQKFWIALGALAITWAFSHLVSQKLDQSIEDEIEQEWSGD